MLYDVRRRPTWPAVRRPPRKRHPAAEQIRIVRTGCADKQDNADPGKGCPNFSISLFSGLTAFDRGVIITNTRCFRICACYGCRRAGAFSLPVFHTAPHTDHRIFSGTLRIPVSCCWPCRSSVGCSARYSINVSRLTN